MQPGQKTLNAQRGHMEMGTPLIIIAILLVLVAGNDALRLPDWGFWTLVGFAALLALGGMCDLLFGFKGMGHNAMKQRRKE